MSITRYSSRESGVAVGATSAASQEVNFSGWAGGTVYVPAGSSITKLTWYASHTRGGTYHKLADGLGTDVETTVAAGKAVAIPTALFGATVIKIVGDVAGSVDVSLKG